MKKDKKKKRTETYFVDIVCDDSSIDECIKKVDTLEKKLRKVNLLLKNLSSIKIKDKKFSV